MRTRLVVALAAISLVALALSACSSKKSDGGNPVVPPAGPSYNLSFPSIGSTGSVTFPNAGTFGYHCAPHQGSGMTGTVQVVAGGSVFADTVEVGPGGTLTFVPSTVTIAAGGTVTWVRPAGSSFNNHTATSH